MKQRKVYTQNGNEHVNSFLNTADAAVADHGKKIEHSEPATDPIKEKGSQATKLLDDLFRKTKATPSIYWLPLSEAEVCVCVCVSMSACVHTCNLTSLIWELHKCPE